MFEIVLWGATGLLVTGLIVFWWRQEVRERREAELGRRWRNATTWNADASARVVRIARVEQGVARVIDGELEIDIPLPDDVPPDVSAGWYLHVARWVPARRAAKKGQTVKLGIEDVRDVFPPHTPALNDRLTGRGDRKAGRVSRLLGLRGM